MSGRPTWWRATPRRDDGRSRGLLRDARRPSHPGRGWGRGRLLTVGIAAAALVLVAAPTALAVPPTASLLWSDTFLEDNTLAEFLDVTSAPDGSTFAAGKASHPAEGWDVVVMKHTATGERAWVRTFRSATHQDEQALAVATSKAGIVVVTGRYRGSSGAWGVLTAAWSGAGKRLWVRRLPRDAGGLTGQGLDVLVTPAGDVYVTGVQVRTGSEDLFVARYSRAGKLVWMKYVAGGAGSWDQGNALAMDGAGNVYAAGWVTNTAPNGRDLVLVKYRPDGKRLWLKTKDAGQAHDDWANAVAIRGGFVVLAGGSLDGDGDTCGMAARYDTRGNLWWWWQVDWIGPTKAEYTQVGVDRYGHTVVAGWKDYAGGAGNDGFVARIEPWGDLDWDWYQRGQGAADDRITGLAVTAEGEIYVAGFYRSIAMSYDAFAVRMRPGGWFTWYATLDVAGGDDGATALDLGPKGVCLGGLSSGKALMAMYGKEPVAP